ncbi:GtrA family protein [Klenkia brasiliensis]|uniref:Putative flippase GtrA (Transmembrane translocase of bactoprenol-linked glucose) n=1 Tax=Klenkia brasiliensis TaxID=333142 RepID=A0A1G7REM0_9ACTN|nr:GtrA family protein [Klenkia brasiliensis]SDG09246.1 Putative flippase GtrA (transmembrane translocase of bactoprenol-linked glucose) [Klenkia brasiliensis]
MAVLDSLLRRTGATWQVLVKELGAFGVVGGVCFVIDIGLFQLLYAHAGWGAVSAKLVSTVVSMTVAYLAHRHWSFSHRARTGARREYTLFAVINGVTLLLGLALVALARYPLGHEDPWVLQVVNVGSIALGTVVRYACYKRWVFPPSAPVGAAGAALPRS